MAADFISSWEPASGAPFSFSGLYELDRDAVTDSGAQRRIPSADANGDGEWATNGLADVRTVTIQGTINADSADELRGAIDALSAAMASRAEGKLYIHSDRYLLCRVSRFDYDPENGFAFRTWRATFKASGVPFWQNDTEWDGDAAADEIDYPALGSVSAPARIEVTVTADGAPAGSITFAHAGGECYIRPSDIGDYIIDGEAGTVTRNGSDAIADFYGVFPRLDPAGGTITITELSGATYSDATAYARARYESL